MDDLALALEDCQAIEAAGLKMDYKLVATSAIASFRYLHHLSSELGKPIDEITRDEIIAALKAQQSKHSGSAA
jgi:hypothetical protein